MKFCAPYLFHIGDKVNQNDKFVKELLCCQAKK
jgi:hypothetical protein